MVRVIDALILRHSQEFARVVGSSPSLSHDLHGIVNHIGLGVALWAPVFFRLRMLAKMRTNATTSPVTKAMTAPNER